MTLWTVRRGSLRVRLLAAGAASVVLALAIAGVGLMVLFERHVERRFVLELEAVMGQLVSGIERGPDGALRIAVPLADPRFAAPLSGMYWQITDTRSGRMLRSRSLWDDTLALPPDELRDGEEHLHRLHGPGHTSLLAVERWVVLPDSLGGGAIRAAVAIDGAEIDGAARAFGADLVPALGGLALVLIAAAWVQVTIGLRPLDTLRRRLGAVRAGRQRRLGEAFPDEVRPLAAEVDHLLAAQEAAIAQARARAADLAHGLKTRLTVLATMAEELHGRGDAALAHEIASLTEGMRRHVERELARTRTGQTSRGERAADLGRMTERVIGVLRRTPRGQDLAWETSVPPALIVAVETEDLAEILGNLLENAVKWAQARVRVAAGREGVAVRLVIADDGPGIADADIATALRRGGRLDEARPGTGLGLAIVADLAEAYGAPLTLGRAALGGLQVELHLPLPGSSGDVSSLRDS